MIVGHSAHDEYSTLLEYICPGPFRDSGHTGIARSIPRRRGFNFYNTTMTLQYHSDVIITKSGHTEDCFVAETSDQKTSEVA